MTGAWRTHCSVCRRFITAAQKTHRVVLLVRRITMVILSHLRRNFIVSSWRRIPVVIMMAWNTCRSSTHSRDSVIATTASIPSQWHVHYFTSNQINKDFRAGQTSRQHELLVLARSILDLLSVSSRRYHAAASTTCLSQSSRNEAYFQL